MNTQTQSHSASDWLAQDVSAHQKLLCSMHMEMVDFVTSYESHVSHMTRHLAIALANRGCANFSAAWHISDRHKTLGRSHWPKRKVSMRLALEDSAESMLRDAYAVSNDAELFDKRLLWQCTRATACAALILASIICGDYIVTEESMAKHVRGLDRQTAIDYIRKVGFTLWMTVCDGCVSATPCVASGVAQTLRTVAMDHAHYAAYISDTFCMGLLTSIEQCRALYTRYTCALMSECTSALIMLALCSDDARAKQAIHKITLKKSQRALRCWMYCLCDCTLIYAHRTLRGDGSRDSAACGIPLRMFERLCYVLLAYQNNSEKRWRMRWLWQLWTLFHTFASSKGCARQQRVGILNQHIAARRLQPGDGDDIRHASPATSGDKRKRARTTSHRSLTAVCSPDQLRQIIEPIVGQAADLGSGGFGAVRVHRIVDARSALRGTIDAFSNLLRDYVGNEWCHAAPPATDKHADAVRAKIGNMVCAEGYVAVKTYFSVSDSEFAIDDSARVLSLNEMADCIQEVNTIGYFSRLRANVEQTVQSDMTLFVSNSKCTQLTRVLLCMPQYRSDLHTFLSRARSQARHACANFGHMCRLITQMAASVALLHSHGFMHRDIKSYNMLVSDDGQNIVLSDFGTCVHLYADKQHAVPCGEATTLWWRSPEHLAQESETNGCIYETSPAADVWSLAICICELCLCSMPFRRHSCEESLALRHWQEFAHTLHSEEHRQAVWYTCVARRKRRPAKFHNADTPRSLRSRILLCVDGQTEFCRFLFEQLLTLDPACRATAKSAAAFFEQCAQQ